MKRSEVEGVLENLGKGLVAVAYEPNNMRVLYTLRELPKKKRGDVTVAYASGLNSLSVFTGTVDNLEQMGLVLERNSNSKKIYELTETGRRAIDAVSWLIVHDLPEDTSLRRLMRLTRDGYTDLISDVRKRVGKIELI